LNGNKDVEHMDSCLIDVTPLWTCKSKSRILAIKNVELHEVCAIW